MNTLAAGLFFIGVMVFLVAALLFGVRLFRVSPAWGMTATLVPPAVLVPFVAYLRRHVFAALLVVVGVYLAVVSGVLWLRMNPSAALLQGVPSVRQWLTPAAMGVPRYERAFPELETSDSAALSGKLRGEMQQWERVEWSGDTLRFSNSGDTQPTAILQIRFPTGWALTENSPPLSITPNQTNAPVIELISYEDGRTEGPSIQVVKRGYWLDIEVAHSSQSLVSGNIRLVLPTPFQTWLTGAFSAYTEDVRYVNGELDRRHDSVETLSHIAASHVSAHLWKWMDGNPVIEQTRFQTSYEPFTGEAVAKVNLGKQGLFDLPLEFTKGESGWYVVPDAAVVLAASLDMQQSPTAAGKQKRDATSEKTSTALKAIERFAELSRHLGATGDLYTIDGRRLNGTLLSAENEQLKLRRKLGSNELTVTISATNFSRFVQSP